MSFLRDITVSAYPAYRMRKEFNLRTNCVCAIYLHELGKFPSNGIKKVIIQACDRTDTIFENLLDVYKISLTFDFETFWKSNSLNQKRQIFFLLYKGLTMIGKRLEWNTVRFDSVFYKLKDSEFPGIFDWGKIVSSPDRRKKAQLRYYYDLESVKLILRVWTAGNQDLANEFLIATTQPHEFKFVPLLGKLSWNETNKLVLYPKQKKLDPIEIYIT